MRPSLRAILVAAAAESGIPAAVLRGKDRQKPIPRVRQLCCHIMRERTDASWGAIGSAMRRDHTTVMYGHRVTALRLPIDDKLQDLRDRVVRRLSGEIVDAPEPVAPEPAPVAPKPPTKPAAPAPTPATPEPVDAEAPLRTLCEPVLIDGHGPLSRDKLAEQEARFAAAMREALA